MEDEEDKDGDFDKMFNDQKDVPDDEYFGTRTAFPPRMNSTKRADFKKPFPTTRNVIPAGPRIPSRTFGAAVKRP